MGTLNLKTLLTLSSLSIILQVLILKPLINPWVSCHLLGSKYHINIAHNTNMTVWFTYQTLNYFWNVSDFGVNGSKKIKKLRKSSDTVLSKILPLQFTIINKLCSINLCWVFKNMPRWARELNCVLELSGVVLKTTLSISVLRLLMTTEELVL